MATAGYAEGRAGEESREQKLADLQAKVASGDLVIRRMSDDDDPLADLDIENEAARLAEVEAERQARHERNVAASEQSSRHRRYSPLGPESIQPESWRRCRCDRPLPGDEAGSCFRCGKAFSVSNGATTPEPIHTENGPVNASAQAQAAGVPWTAQDEAELRELAQRQGATSWELGDVCCRCIPVAASRRPSGANALVRDLAERVGVAFGTLKMVRHTSHAWPHEHRLDGIAWTVFAEFTAGGPAKAAKRAQLLRRLANDGPVTVARVRAARGRTPRVAKVDPLDRFLTRTERFAAAFDRLPPLEPTRHHARGERLNAAALNLRRVADRLEQLAA